MGKKITENDISELFGRVKALEKKLGVIHIPKGLKIGDMAIAWRTKDKSR